MRRRLVSFLAGVLLVSCSDDSSPVKSKNSPAAKRISSSITWSQPVAGVNNLAEQRPAGTAEQAPEPETPQEEFVVSGTIRNETGADLTGAKVVAWWGVVTGEDYNYFFGEGTVDVQDLTFEMVLSEAPPPEALNRNLGVAYLLIAKPSATGMEEPGVLPEDYDYFENILGGATRHCVIFSTGENVNGIQWVEEFEPGYSVGKGVEIPDYHFEGFEPVDPSSVEIVVDDLENLVFVNWT